MLNVLNIKKKDYYTAVEIGDELDALDSIREYDSGYICDVISEIADSYVPIYTGDLWEKAYIVRDEIASEIAEYGESVDYSMEKWFSVGFYRYYSDVMYASLNVMLFNYAINYLNDFVYRNEKYQDKSVLEKIAPELSEQIEEMIAECDSNSNLDTIRENLTSTFIELYATHSEPTKIINVVWEETVRFQKEIQVEVPESFLIDGEEELELDDIVTEHINEIGWDRGETVREDCIHSEILSAEIEGGVQNETIQSTRSCNI